MGYNTQKYIDWVCKDRGLPKIKKGTRCEVDGLQGLVWGGNWSGNFNVKTMYGIMNCHPYWRMKIFNQDGSILYTSEKQSVSMPKTSTVTNDNKEVI
jgi:hypothetical protein